MEEDDHTLLYRNIDAKVDPFSMHIEKHLMKLPDSLQFIKEYIYFDFIPKFLRNYSFVRIVNYYFFIIRSFDLLFVFV